jgi:3-methyladenine DNA glycosylase AlkD
MDTKQVLQRLRKLSNPANVEGMARFGINPAKTFGVRIPVLRALAKEIGTDHALALALWDSGYHEARILASMIDDPGKVSRTQMDRWVKDFDSWDVCDQCCMNLFRYTPWAWDKAKIWSGKKPEFVKRAGFAMMACLVADRTAGDEAFAQLLPLIRREAGDDRNFVKKAVNWALRSIGKRSKRLNRLAIAEAKAIRKIESPSAKWIATDALRELQDPATRARLKS